MIKFTVMVPCEIEAESLFEAKAVWQDLKGSGVSQSDGVNSFTLRTDRVRWKECLSQLKKAIS